MFRLMYVYQIIYLLGTYCIGVDYIQSIILKIILEAISFTLGYNSENGLVKEVVS